MKRALFVCLLLAGCKEDNTPRWVDVCVSSHQEQTMQLVPLPWYMVGGVQIGGGMSLRPVQQTVCDRTERRCMIGKSVKDGAFCS